MEIFVIIRSALSMLLGDGGLSPSNLTFDNIPAVLISEALNDLSLFAGPNERRSHQIMDQGSSSMSGGVGPPISIPRLTPLIKAGSFPSFASE